jgi:hypothetical protein
LAAAGADDLQPAALAAGRSKPYNFDAAYLNIFEYPGPQGARPPNSPPAFG